MKDLIKAYKDYIKFLGEEIDSNAVYLYIHGIHPIDDKIKKGIELRDRIRKLEEKYNIT